jgi:hypothetical protein
MDAFFVFHWMPGSSPGMTKGLVGAQKSPHDIAGLDPAIQGPLASHRQPFFGISSL